MRTKAGLIAALVALAILLLIALALLRSVPGVARLSGGRIAPEPDPMFAEPAEVVTRPPEPSEDARPVVSGDDDPSKDWVYETLTPVERTAEQLAGAS